MNALQRLQQFMPKHIKPMSYDDLKAYREREATKHAKALRIERQRALVRNAIGHSGIKKRHLKCNFDNYQVTNQGQEYALTMAKNILESFSHRSGRSFIFAGLCGTGKNHLACAIANDLLDQNKSVVVITVEDLMTRLRSSYNRENNISESQIINHLSMIDLLVIDEVGVQRRNEFEAVKLNNLINNRNINELATGVLTNLEASDLYDCLGERVIERLLENGDWVSFTWESFRKRKGQQ